MNDHPVEILLKFDSWLFDVFSRAVNQHFVRPTLIQLKFKRGRDKLEFSHLVDFFHNLIYES